MAAATLEHSQADCLALGNAVRAKADEVSTIDSTLTTVEFEMQQHHAARQAGRPPLEVFAVALCYCYCDGALPAVLRDATQGAL